MKNLMGAVMMLCSVSSAVASDLKEQDYDWTRTFTLASGFEICHRSDAITCAGCTFGQVISNSKGSNFMGMRLEEDQELKLKSTLEDFRKEVQKFGPIAWER